MYAPASLTLKAGISFQSGASGLFARIMFLMMKVKSGDWLLLVMSMMAMVKNVNFSIFSGSMMKQKMRHMHTKMPILVT